MESEMLFGYMSNILWETSNKISAILSNAKDIVNPLTSQGFQETPFDFIKRAPSVNRRSPTGSVERVNGPIIVPYHPENTNGNHERKVKRKVHFDPMLFSKNNENDDNIVKRKRGRPRKHFFDENGNKLKRKGGRPRKVPLVESLESVVKKEPINSFKVKRKKSFSKGTYEMSPRRSSRIKESEKKPIYTFKRPRTGSSKSVEQEQSIEEPLEKRMFKEVQGVNQEERKYYGVNQLGEEFSCALDDISNHINVNTTSITRISARVRLHDRIGVFVKFDTFPEEILMNISPSIDEARRKLVFST